MKKENFNHPPITYHGLTFLRALAILLVFFFHYKNPIYGHPDWVADFGKFGWTGVDLFFILSGFLIASQLFKQIKAGEEISLMAFFQKRFWRIIPAYWAILLVYFVFPDFHERESLSSLWKFLTFTQNFNLDQKEFGTFTHAWSLCVEEHFYIVFPLLLLLLYRIHRLQYGSWLILLFFLSGFILRFISWDFLYFSSIGQPNAQVEWFKYVYYPTYNRLDGLLVGISIAAMVYFRPAFWRRVSNYGNFWLLIGICTLVGAYFLCREEKSYAASVVGFPLVAIGYGMIVVGAVSKKSLLFNFKSKPVTFIATISYSYYLSHKGVIHVVQILFKDCIEVNGNFMLLISILSCTMVAAVLYFLVEKPCMQWGYKLVSRGKKQQ